MWTEILFSRTSAGRWPGAALFGQSMKGLLNAFCRGHPGKLKAAIPRI
jgi:hypothetical protein